MAVARSGLAHTYVTSWMCKKINWSVARRVLTSYVVAKPFLQEHSRAGRGPLSAELNYVK